MGRGGVSERGMGECVRGGFCGKVGWREGGGENSVLSRGCGGRGGEGLRSLLFFCECDTERGEGWGAGRQELSQCGRTLFSVRGKGRMIISLSSMIFFFFFFFVQ